MLALATAQCVGPDAGRKALEEVYRVRGRSTLVPEVHLALGDRERGLPELEAFVEQPLKQLGGVSWFLKVDPQFDGVRGEPRFGGPAEAGPKLKLVRETDETFFSH